MATPLHKLLDDIRIWKPKGVGGHIRLLLLEPGFHLVVLIRLVELLRSVPVAGALLGRIVWYVARVWTACDISPVASIGGGFYLPHATGIVIGGSTRIGRNVTVMQGVTLGKLKAGGADERIVVEDGAQITAGAKILGDVTIGKGAIIGANAVVLQDVPARAVAVGVPARILKAKK